MSAKGKFTFADKDKGYKKLREELTKLERTSVTVGVHSDAGMHPDAGVEITVLAGWHEFGLGVPERSFLRATFDEKKARLENAIRKAVSKVITTRGKFTAVQANTFIGESFKVMVEQKIRARIPPPIANVTKEKRIEKGYSPDTPPLIASHVLLNSIESKVHK